MGFMIARYLSYPLFILSMSLATATILPAYILRDIYRLVARYALIRILLILLCVFGLIYWGPSFFDVKLALQSWLKS